VLLRVLRGAGAKGLSGISPSHREKGLVRPFLGIRRSEIEQYLRKLKQPWREDSSNKDLSHTRNRIRHQLLPMLELHFNPATCHTLTDLAEIAQAERDYWEQEIAKILPRLLLPGKPSRTGRSVSGDASHIMALDLAAMRSLPLALQRQILHRVASDIGLALEFKHIQQLTDSIQKPKPGRRIILPASAMASITYRELQFTRNAVTEPAMAYTFRLQVPGEVAITALGSTIRARVIRPFESELSGYNPALLLDRALLQSELTVRNWQAGDRFFPAHSRSPKKVKELLQSGRLGRPLAPAERLSWPVVESAGQIVWMRGFAVPEAFSYRAGDAVLIEEVETITGAE
jgi:tRNA(Ile)-lysidine synthase